MEFSPGCLVVGLLAVFVLLAVGPQGSQADRRRCTVEDYRAGAPKEGFICGNRIPEVLFIICEGSYAGSTSKRAVGKRSEGSGRSWADDNWSDLGLVQEHRESNNLAWDEDDIFMPKKAALSLLRHKRDQFRSGVYCECCRHKCEFREVRHYCSTADRDKRSAPALSMDDPHSEQQKSQETYNKLNLS
nr:IRP-4 [Urechis unicinctus]